MSINIDTSGIDLRAYFERIGFDGPAAADLDTLCRLHLLHAQAIPFENLSPLLGLEVRLDIVGLFDKLVTQRRGGYCYEHNVLFRHVLDSMGYRTTGLAARVRMNVAEDVPTARTHMLLLVELDNAHYIADTGFGGMTLTAPLRLVPGITQDTPHGQFRLLETDGSFQLQCRQAQQWQTLYMFDLQPQLAVDYAVSSWYLCHHPHSPFVRGLMAARPVPEGRHALRNERYTFYRSDGTASQRTLESASALRDVLTQAFGVSLAHLPDLDDRLDEWLSRWRSM